MVDKVTQTVEDEFKEMLLWFRSDHRDLVSFAAWLDGLDCATYVRRAAIVAARATIRKAAETKRACLKRTDGKDGSDVK